MFAKLSNELGKIEFVQDDLSYSRYGVLRGLHGDDRTWKLISCVMGSFLLTLVDCRPESKTYKTWIQMPMSSLLFKTVLVPPMFANGHLCTSEKCIFHYKQSEYYHPERQFVIKWNDPALNIPWPNKDPILSKRDTEGPFLRLGK